LEYRKERKDEGKSEEMTGRNETYRGGRKGEDRVRYRREGGKHSGEGVRDGLRYGTVYQHL
jgi:hypothetical protein